MHDIFKLDLNEFKLPLLICLLLAIANGAAIYFLGTNLILRDEKARSLADV